MAARGGGPSAVSHRGSLLHVVDSRWWGLDSTTSLVVDIPETSENQTHYSLFTNSRTVIQIIKE